MHTRISFLVALCALVALLAGHPAIAQTDDTLAAWKPMALYPVPTDSHDVICTSRTTYTASSGSIASLGQRVEAVYWASPRFGVFAGVPLVASEERWALTEGLRSSDVQFLAGMVIVPSATPVGVTDVQCSFGHAFADDHGMLEHPRNLWHAHVEGSTGWAHHELAGFLGSGSMHPRWVRVRSRAALFDAGLSVVSAGFQFEWSHATDTDDAVPTGIDLRRAGGLVTLEGTTRTVPFQVILAILHEAGDVGPSERHNNIVDIEARVDLFSF